MLPRLLVAFVCCALVACSSDPQPSQPKPPMRTTYSYSLPPPMDELRPGETRTLTWTVAPHGQSDRYPATAKLCFAVFGPYADGTVLKSSTMPRPMCPMNDSGTVFASDVAAVDLFSGTAVTQELRLPRDAAAGFYKIVQVTDWGGGNYMAASGAFKVSGTP